MAVRGVRGAITIEHDTPEEIQKASQELLRELLRANPEMVPGDIASVFFTVTDDVKSDYPARAARLFGWHSVPLMCAREIPVQGSLALCIRVLIHWNTPLLQKDIRHVYLKEAVRLRPDLAGSNIEFENENQSSVNDGSIS